jgi:hypothetical protein
MSAISSKSVNPPVACEGVSFAYPTGSVPTPASGQLGNLTNVISGAVTTPISGTSQNQIYLTAGSVGAGIPAGSYVAYSISSVTNMVGNFNSYIEVVDATDGTSVITDSAGSYVQGAASTEQSLVNVWYFTCTIPFMVYSRLRTYVSGTNTGTPVDNGSLQIVRIA